MVKDVYKNIEGGTGYSLFVDDVQCGLEEGNLKFIVKKLQGAIIKVEEWSHRWGFKFCVDKTKYDCYKQQNW